jgi:hypothetical protein
VPRTTPFKTLSLRSDAAANDSDKTYTVPTDKQWLIKSIDALLATTAAVGNRLLTILITTAADVVLMKYVAGAVQPASQSYTYIFAPLHPQETGFTGDVMLRAIAGDLVVPAGYKIRIYDSAAIAAAADDLTLQLLVEEWTD